MKNHQKKNLCLAMNGKRGQINNTSKHVVLVSSPLSVLSSFSLYCYSMASPRSAWHCMPALRALAILDRLGRVLASQNLPKIARRLLKSRSGSVLWPPGRVLDRLGAVLERLCGILGRLGAYLVRLGAILGRLGAILAHLGRHLGASLGRLGGVLGRLGRALGN